MSNIVTPCLPVGLWEPVSSSYIMVRRGLFDPQSPLAPMYTGQKACPGYAWLDLVSRAEYADGRQLLRGEQVAAQSYLAARWKWSDSTVQKFLKDLAEAKMLVRVPQGGTKASHLFIRDYDFYNRYGAVGQGSTAESSEGANPGSDVVPIYSQVVEGRP